MSSETTKNTYKAITGKAWVNHLLSNALSDLKLTFHLEKLDISIPENEFGDFSTNTALVLAKKLKVSPKELAQKIIEQIKLGGAETRLESIEEKTGFINFRLSKEFLLAEVDKILELGDLYGASIQGNGEKILIEYFQPNVAKPLHLGHLRTAIIGDSLFRILSSQGFKLESDTHLGDWGTQFGLLLLAYKKYGDMSLIEKDPINELNKLYVKINAEIEKDPLLREEGKQEFVKLEKGDAENRKLWKQFRDWSWKEYEVIYKDLEIRKADNDWPESFFEDKMPAVLNELKQKGMLKESQGAQIVDLEEQGLGVAVLVKSDGGTTYLLRDLATYIFRKSQGFKKQIYVVDVRQSHTLKQTFAILQQLGHIVFPTEAVHVAYGFLTLPEGAMSTRKGTVVGAADFIKGVQESALKIIEEKNPSLEKKQEVANKVASSALKYFDLSHNLRSDIVFDPKTAISFEGKTGPYLQYTHARIQGIIRKNQNVDLPELSVKAGIKNQNGHNVVASFMRPDKSGDYNINLHELLLMRKLQYFPEIVKSAAENMLPSTIANYLFELAQSFNSFYQEVPVVQEENIELKKFRLGLITATAQVLRNGLYLLGIEAPEQM
ncbi:MAG: arginine--tRNA ligase [Candidatus Doudnabacteria bacterium]|nr:arginine--tRNA ligase [Candidatus Doudnabacteria bacterium]